MLKTVALATKKTLYSLCDSRSIESQQKNFFSAGFHKNYLVVFPAVLKRRNRALKIMGEKAPPVHPQKSLKINCETFFSPAKKTTEDFQVQRGLMRSYDNVRKERGKKEA